MTEPAEAPTGSGRAPVVASSLRGYRREWLVTDVLAGVTLLAIAVPEQLATSRLAGMPPVTGFYAFVAGTVLFALLGSNPRMSVGADSTIAPLFAVGVARFAASGTPEYQDLIGILAVMVGVLVAIVWLARLGWISELLSAPIITGFPRRDRGDHHRAPVARPARGAFGWRLHASPHRLGHLRSRPPQRRDAGHRARGVRADGRRRADRRPAAGGSRRPGGSDRRRRRDQPEPSRRRRAGGVRTWRSTVGVEASDVGHD